eukprot:1151411-Pelagomonas_calceolata.AAC.2
MEVLGQRDQAMTGGALAPSYSCVAERVDLYPILKASCALCLCSHRRRKNVHVQSWQRAHTCTDERAQMLLELQLCNPFPFLRPRCFPTSQSHGFSTFSNSSSSQPVKISAFPPLSPCYKPATVAARPQGKRIPKAEALSIPISKRKKNRNGQWGSEGQPTVPYA